MGLAHLAAVKRVLLTLCIGFVVLYLLAGSVMFIAQRNFIFPAPQEAVPLPKNFERVALRTSDGLNLAAAYRAASLGKPTIVFFHGNGDSWAGAAVATETLANAGFGILLPEYRGYAGNPGTPNEEGLYDDGRAAINWLHGKGVSSDQIVIVGNSVGSGVATQMAVEFQPSALILVSPFSSLPEAVSENIRWLPATLLVRDRFDNKAKLGQFTGPLLLLHGRADRLISAQHSRRLAKVRPDAQLALIPDVGHNLAYLPDTQAIEREWLDKVFAVPADKTN